MEQLTTRRSRISLETIETLLHTIKNAHKQSEAERGRELANTTIQSNMWDRSRLAAATQNDFWIQVVGLRNQANAR